MERLEPFLSIAVAIGVGLLIGLEREQATTDDDQDVMFAGVRTHALVALIGATSTLVSAYIGAWFIALAFVVLTVFLVLAYHDDLRHGRGRGLTSEAAFLLCFLLGVLALNKQLFAESATRLIVTASIAVATTTLLSLKASLRSFAHRISRADVFATLKFLIVTVILLPLLPDQAYGPLDALNPFHIGTMIVLIAGLGFVGYVAVRVLGPGRGLGITGLVGGLVSSTAVTLSMAARAKEEPQVAPACALSVVLASTIMFGRVVLEVFVVNRSLVKSVLIPMGAMALAGLVVSGVFYRRSKGVKAASSKVSLKNPFELSSAIKFGLLFAVVLLISKAANQYLGAEGNYVAGLLAGTTDVDAITLSMANLAKEGALKEPVAATTILLATASNTIVKGVTAAVLGGRAFGTQILGAFGMMLVAGGVGTAVLWLT